VQYTTSVYICTFEFRVLTRIGFKTCLSKTKTKTTTLRFQDHDSEVPRPRLRGSRPRLRGSRPRLVKTSLETKTQVSRTPCLSASYSRLKYHNSLQIFVVADSAVVVNGSFYNCNFSFKQLLLFEFCYKKKQIFVIDRILMITIRHNSGNSSQTHAFHHTNKTLPTAHL